MTLRALLVGNHPDLGELVAPHLERAGFDVTWLERWFGATLELDGSVPDLFVGHAEGPTDRYGLARVLQAFDPAPPAIAIASGPSTVPGCAYDLRYPVDVGELDRILRSALPQVQLGTGPNVPAPPVAPGASAKPPSVSLLPGPIAPAHSIGTVPLSATDIDVFDEDDSPPAASDATPSPPVESVRSAPTPDSSATSGADVAAAEARQWLKSDDAVDDHGELAGYRLADVLHRCAVQMKTGVITLEREGHHKRVYLQGGVPVFVRSRLREETLGAYLLNKGVISDDQHRVALAKMTDSGRRMGEVLIDMGAFRARDAYRHLTDHVQSKLISAFGWTEGSYTLRELPRLPAEITGVPMQAPALIVRGLAAHFDPTRVDPEFASMLETASGLPVDEPAHGPDQLRLSPRAAVIRDELEHGASVESLSRAVDAPREFVLGVTYALYVLQIIGLTERRVSKPRRPRDERRSQSSIDLEDDTVEILNETCDAFLDEYLRLSPLDCFEILGLDLEEDDDAAVDRALERLKIRLHPEVFDRDEIEPVLDKVNELWAQIYLAHRTLSTEEGRSRYRRSLQDSLSNHNDAAVATGARALAAESLFKLGRKALASGDLVRAIEAFDGALHIDPIEPTYLAHRAWSMYSSDPRENRQHAIAELNTARLLDSSYAGVSYFLGRICLDDGANEIAIGYFEMALRTNPDLHEAEQYLQIAKSRAFAARRPAPQTRGSRPLERLFRRKT